MRTATAFAMVTAALVAWHVGRAIEPRPKMAIADRAAAPAGPTRASSTALRAARPAAGDAPFAAAKLRGQRNARATTSADVDPGRPERLQERWAGETEDGAWTEAATESLADMLESAGLEAEVVEDIECRATVCRIELAFGDFAAATKLAPLMAAQAEGLEVVPAAANANANGVAAGTDPAPDSEPRFVVYAARPGVRIEHVLALDRGI